MLGFIAAQEASAMASVHGSALMRPIGAGTLDGFAAGMLLSGIVLLAIVAKRHSPRPAARQRRGRTPYTGLGQDLEPEWPKPRPDVADLYGDADREIVLQPGARLSDWLAAEPEATAPDLRELGSPGLTEKDKDMEKSQVKGPASGTAHENQGRRPAVHHSKHRAAGPEDSKDGHRRKARHAAPSTTRFGVRPGLVSRMMPLRQLRLAGADE
jgi:hypothetical protein